MGHGVAVADNFNGNRNPIRIMAITTNQRLIFSGIGVGVVIGLVMGVIGAYLNLSAGVRGGITGALIVAALQILRRQMKKSAALEDERRT